MPRGTAVLEEVLRLEALRTMYRTEEDHTAPRDLQDRRHLDRNIRAARLTCRDHQPAVAA